MRALAGILMSLPALAAFSGSAAFSGLARAPGLSLRAHGSSQAVPGSRHRERIGVSRTMLQSKIDDAQNPLELLTLLGASLPRPGAGAFVAGYRAETQQDYKNPTLGLPIREFSETLPSYRPAIPLELYEYEACPFCRKVREAVSMLDIDVIVYPCPRDGARYRGNVTSMGGKSQFPYLVDPNTKFESYESDRIIRYLFQTYGDGIIPLPLTLGPLTTSSAALVSAIRVGKGRQAKPDLPPAPELPLEFWSYEASPFCRVVREMLCELELAHKVITVARGSSKREALVALAGKMQVPYLVDPNTGTAMFESSDINAYLLSTYGPGAAGSSKAEVGVEGEEEAAPDQREAGKQEVLLLGCAGVVVEALLA
jgi:glutathione S-transferase